MNRSETMKQLWQDPVYRENMAASHRGKPLPAAQRRKIGAAHRGMKRSLVTKRRISESQKRRWNKYSSLERARITSIGLKSADAERRKWWESLSNEEKKERLERAYQARRTPEARERQSLLSRRLWQDSNYRQKTVKAWFKANCLRPNKLEQRMQTLLEDLFPDQYEYVGGGQLILCGKCPDFANVNGQKKLIEVFGDYWHRGEDPAWRIALFARLGFQTLVVWESELANEPEMVVERLREFHEK